MKSRVIFLFVILIFLSVTPVFGKAKKSLANGEVEDMSLFEIDRLIRRTEFEQALKQLNNYLENNPENFDNAQSRIARIMRARREYKDGFESLVATFAKINKNIDNEESVDEFIDDLEDTDEDAYYAQCNKIKDRLNSIEHNPPTEIKQVLNQIDSTITLNYVRPRAEKILRRSARYAERGDYLLGLEQVKEGFEFFKVDYYIQWENYEDIIAQTDQIAADLNAHILEFEEGNLNQRLNNAVEAFTNSVNNDLYTKALENLVEVQSCLKEYAELRKKIYDDAISFQNLFEKEKELNPDATSTDASYLPFMIRFINGSSDIKNSGVAGVLGCQIDNLITAMNDSVYAMLNQYYQNYTKVLRENMTVSQELAQNTDDLSSGIKNYSSLENAVIKTYYDGKTGYEIDKDENPAGTFVTLVDYLPKLVEVSNKIYSVNGQINTMREIQVRSIEQINSDISASEKETVVNSLFNYVAQTGNLVGIKAQQEITAYDWANVYQSEERTEWNELGELYTTILDKVFEDSSSMLNQSWENISNYYIGQSDLLVQVIEEYNTYTFKYYDGFYTKISNETHSELARNAQRAIALVNTFETDESLNTGIYYSYPDIAKNLSAYVQTQITQNTNTITGYDTLINSVYIEHPQWGQDEGITGLVNDTHNYFLSQNEKLDSLRSEVVGIAANAQEKIDIFEEQWNNGNERYEYAKWALEQENFDLARSSLTEAGNYFSDALTYQDNELKNQESYEKLQTLRDQITKTENEYVVREVRQHINNAWSDFYAGRYDEASEQLAQAELRWKTTNYVENEEIRKLRGYVNNARSSKAGFEILPSDALYLEMSQRLSTAAQYYDSGVAKYNSGDKAGGNADFIEADNILNEVKKAYPLNLNAQILTLKIEKVKNPTEFNKNFKDKVDEAANQCKSKDSEMQERGYAYLKAYYEIDPEFKGLKNKLNQAEIDTGKKPQPVDNSIKNKAQNYYAQALKTYNNAGTNQAKLRQALNLVDQAIDLDSTLRSATALKDDILIKIGGTASPELSPADRVTFNQAQIDIDNNNIRRARTTLEKMLKQHPDYANIEEFMALYNEAMSL